MSIDHSLCGELSVEGFFDGLPVDGDPLMYDAATSTFSARTTDGGLIGDEPIILPYSLEAHFVNYPPADNPTVATASATADIEFNNPCWDPFEFAAVAQSGSLTDNYTGNELLFTLDRFTMDPPRCKIRYECTGVARTDGADSMISCADFAFDGLYDGQATDGQLTFEADSNDYLS